jgi:lipopolysaccharide/colanic/teichoic acid biosynthesis glycosyltransferase
MASSYIAAVPGDSFEAVVDISAIPTVRMPLWKRSMDVMIASFALVLTSPLLVLIAIAVMADSPGGAIFRQVRVGRGGKCFTCWKFRTMQRGADSMLVALMSRNEANEFVFKMKDDPRRTRVGRILRKTSLDELPQLWNVVRGSMSLVGPRPPTVPEVLRYDEHHLRRLGATPGITGLWQVTLRGRSHEFIDMVELDIRYANEFSFAGDVRILLNTIPTVLLGRGSY